MRQTVDVRDGSVSFGFDKLTGVFIQYFLNDKEEPVFDSDQSEVLTGTAFSSVKLTRSVIDGFLETQPEFVKDELDKFLNKEIGEVILGYITDKNGNHQGSVTIKTYEDWINFFDNVDSHFILTNRFDMLIIKR